MAANKISGVLYKYIWLELLGCCSPPVTCRRWELWGKQRRGGHALQVLHLQRLLQKPHHHQVSLTRFLSGVPYEPPSWPFLPPPPPPGVVTISVRPALSSTTASQNDATFATLRPTACSIPPKVCRRFAKNSLSVTQQQLHLHFFFTPSISELIAKMEKRQALADQPPSEDEDNDDD